MQSGVDYYNVEKLQIYTGFGNDVINIRGTGARISTDLFLGEGDDQIFVSSEANVSTPAEGKALTLLPGKYVD